MRREAKVLAVFRFDRVPTEGDTDEIAEINAIQQVSRQFEFFMETNYTSIVHYEAEVIE